MSPAANDLPKRNRKIHRVSSRKTSVFTVTGKEHQQLVLEALQAREACEPRRWKRTRLRWMIRRLTQTLHVHERTEDAR